MAGRQFQFEWNDEKALRNIFKHDVSFELASTVFYDPHLLTLADIPHSESEERWFSVGCASNGSFVSVAYVWIETESSVTIRLISARKATKTEIRYYQKGPMSNLISYADSEMPEEVDFSKGRRGLHHIPAKAAVFMPASIEKNVWEYFADKAERQGIELSALLSEVLKRDIEINEALK